MYIYQRIKYAKIVKYVYFSSEIKHVLYVQTLSNNFVKGGSGEGNGPWPYGLPPPLESPLDGARTEQYCICHCMLQLLLLLDALFYANNGHCSSSAAGHWSFTGLKVLSHRMRCVALRRRAVPRGAAWHRTSAHPYRMPCCICIAVTIYVTITTIKKCV